jgi:hypothetical protein
MDRPFFLAALALHLALALAAGCRKAEVDATTVPLVDAAAMANTDVLPFADGPLEPGRNYIYCATFTLAWQQLEAELGQAPVLIGAEEWSQRLNDDPFDKTQLNERDYLARAGRIEKGIVADFRREMAERFPNATMPVPDAPQKKGIYALAYLLKKLPFEQRFERLDDPVQFAAAGGTTAVRSFGVSVEGQDWERKSAMRDQVAVLDYASDDDFILSLQPKEERDVIVIAKVAPAATLRATIDAVKSRVAQSDYYRREVTYEEPLAIPTVSLYVQRQFEELTGKPLANVDDEIIVQAFQAIRFSLDEKGAELESMAGGTTTTTEGGPVPKPRKFIVDKPFLLMLRETDAAEPYLAMWIANTDVLAPE